MRRAFAALGCPLWSVGQEEGTLNKYIIQVTERNYFKHI